jgi:hypothetical protein
MRSLLDESKMNLPCDFVTLNQTSQLHAPFEFEWRGKGLEGIAVKDGSKGVVLKRYPQLEPLVEHLFGLLPDKKFKNVDVFHLDFSKESKTCKNADWHLDGKMLTESPEHYAIWCDGDYRTKFMHTPMQVEKDRIEAAQGFSRFVFFKEFLGKDLHNDELGEEVPNKTPISYTTFDFHKGRNVTAPEGERFFIRVMTSDFIAPKNNFNFQI